MESEAFPQQPSQSSKRIETPERSISLFEKVASTYRSAKERLANLTKRTPKEVPKSFSDAVALETKIQEQIGRTIFTVDDEVVARAALARQTFMDRLEGVSTKGMRRELAKLEAHLAMFERGFDSSRDLYQDAKKAFRDSGNEEVDLIDIEGLKKRLDYYQGNLEEVQLRIQALRQKLGVEKARGFSFFRKAESL